MPRRAHVGVWVATTVTQQINVTSENTKDMCVCVCVWCAIAHFGGGVAREQFVGIGSLTTRWVLKSNPGLLNLCHQAQTAASALPTQPALQPPGAKTCLNPLHPGAHYLPFNGGISLL